MDHFTQEAIYNGQGSCCSIAIFKQEGELSEAEKKALAGRAAHLMEIIEQRAVGGDPQYRPENLQVLVAVSNRLLAVPGKFTEFPEEGFENTSTKRTMKRGNGQGDVLVQVAAANEADRRYALRLAVEMLEHGYGEPEQSDLKIRHREVHGARIFSGLEPFGYRDAPLSGFEGYPPTLVDAVTLLAKTSASGSRT
jgi:deferrochelatase/peroxidase EfeB